MAFFFRSKKPPTSPKPTPAPGSAGDGGQAIAPHDPAMEARIQEIGSEFLRRSREDKSGLLSTAFWSDKLMDWSMQDENFKVQLFHTYHFTQGTSML